MQIKADIHSKAYKRGFLKALFPDKAGKVGLSEFVGTLELAGISGADFALLHAMYKHVFCFGDKARGAIAVFDQEGKEVMRYAYKPAEAALSAPVAHGDGWISVKERLPEFTRHIKQDNLGYSDEVLVFCSDGNGAIIQATYNQFEGKEPKWVNDHEGSELEYVTHWRPLPAAPVAQDVKEKQA